MIINWRERIHSSYSFKVQDLGVLPKDNQYVQVYDLWTHNMVGQYTLQELEYFTVENIPGHGNFTFRFKIVNMDGSSDEEFIQ